MRPSPHGLAFVVGALIAGALGGWLSHRFAAQALADSALESARRGAVVELQALGTLVARSGADEDGLRKAVAAWQEKAPGIAKARVLMLTGMRLVASTAREDSGDKAAPRRLQREEKPVFDRAQRLGSAVDANKEEQSARKAEIEIATLPGSRLSLAAPILDTSSDEGGVSGMVEIETTVLPAPPPEPRLLYLVSVLLPVLLILGMSFFVRGRAALAVASVILVAAGLFFASGLGASRAQSARRQGADAVRAAVESQLKVVGSVSPAPEPGAAEPAPLDGKAWDVDAYRRPLGLLTAGPDGTLRVDEAGLASGSRKAEAALRRSLLGADLVCIALLMFAGMGWAQSVGRTLLRHREAYLYIAPAMLGMLVLVFFPFFYGITLSFTDSNLYNSSQPISELWIGLANYTAILGDFSVARHGEGGWVWNYLNFYWTLLFTIVWTVTNVAIGVTSGLILALILNTKGLAFRPVYRVLLILPWAMPNYITALIWKGMFHRQFGVINHVLEMVGIPALSWFDRPLTSFLTALITNGWLSFPFMMVVSLGALQSIPADLYEAARVDGATRWQQFRAITLPSLRPALVPAVVLSVVWTFNMFNIIFLVTGGEPGGATEILVTQAYKFAFERYRYGYAAAYSTVIFGILLIYGSIQNRISRATEA